MARCRCCCWTMGTQEGRDWAVGVQDLISVVYDKMSAVGDGVPPSRRGVTPAELMAKIKIANSKRQQKKASDSSHAAPQMPAEDSLSQPPPNAATDDSTTAGPQPPHAAAASPQSPVEDSQPPHAAATLSAASEGQKKPILAELSDSSDDDGFHAIDRQEKMQKMITWMQEQAISLARAIKYAEDLYNKNIPTITKLSTKLCRDKALLTRMMFDPDDAADIIEAISEMDFSHLTHHHHYREGLRRASTASIEGKEVMSSSASILSDLDSAGESKKLKKTLKKENKEREMEALALRFEELSAAGSELESIREKQAKKDRKELKKQREQQEALIGHGVPTSSASVASELESIREKQAKKDRKELKNQLASVVGEKNPSSV